MIDAKQVERAAREPPSWEVVANPAHRQRVRPAVLAEEALLPCRQKGRGVHGTGRPSAQEDEALALEAKQLMQPANSGQSWVALKAFISGDDKTTGQVAADSCCSKSFLMLLKSAPRAMTSRVKLTMAMHSWAF